MFFMICRSWLNLLYFFFVVALSPSKNMYKLGNSKKPQLLSLFCDPFSILFSSFKIYKTFKSLMDLKKSMFPLNHCFFFKIFHVFFVFMNFECLPKSHHNEPIITQTNHLSIIPQLITFVTINWPRFGMCASWTLPGQSNNWCPGVVIATTVIFTVIVIHKFVYLSFIIW